jgi:hypothetical protein
MLIPEHFVDDLACSAERSEMMATWIDDCEATGIITAISEWKLALEPINRVPRLFLHAKRAVSTCVHACETLYKYYKFNPKFAHPLSLSL